MPFQGGGADVRATHVATLRGPGRFGNVKLLATWRPVTESREQIWEAGCTWGRILTLGHLTQGRS